ncbi:MAG TPA: AAA family ATPase [Coxiellaceae bacterium]|nr:AAA family ATPase [Coxiellaceae bacterium]
MQRIYQSLIAQHLQHYKQMLFLAGPRQVGKTTLSLATKPLAGQFTYLNWDNSDHRKIILEGPAAIAHEAGVGKAQPNLPIIVFDELHKYRLWKNFLKGFFDTYRDQLRILLTGSSKLDVYRRGGDSLMGRYFPYRIHPFSVAETLRTEINNKIIQIPKPIETETFDALFEFGGFPEPFINRNKQFSRRWKQLRQEQLFREDIRDISQLQDIHRLEILAELIKSQAGQLTNYSNLANKIQVSIQTIQRWVKVLSDFYYCFTIKPWSKNIPRSLLKGPKIYLWDWSEIEESGMRSENFIASHLLKAVNFWTDSGLGDYSLYFLRDKDKNEVDFLVTQDKKPWFLVEVKHSNNNRISPLLEKFQQQTGAKHAFQVVMKMDYVDIDCFSYQKPIIVPAKTFLSQLV